jgi:hypothetical protein
MAVPWPAEGPAAGMTLHPRAQRDSAGIVSMSHGVERRAQVDIETLKTSLLINGDGAVSLLANHSDQNTCLFFGPRHP